MFLLLRSWTAVLLVPAISFVWPIARRFSTWFAMKTGCVYLTMGLAGLVGASCVALAISIAHRRLHLPSRLAGAAATGFLAALPFGLWLVSYKLRINSVPDPLQPIRLRYAFGIWQTAVGT